MPARTPLAAAAGLALVAVLTFATAPASERPLSEREVWEVAGGALAKVETPGECRHKENCPETSNGFLNVCTNDEDDCGNSGYYKRRAEICTPCLKETPDEPEEGMSAGAAALEGGQDTDCENTGRKECSYFSYCFINPTTEKCEEAKEDEKFGPVSCSGGGCGQPL